MSNDVSLVLSDGAYKDLALSCKHILKQDAAAFRKGEAKSLIQLHEVLLLVLSKLRKQFRHFSRMNLLNMDHRFIPFQTKNTFCGFAENVCEQLLRLYSRNDPLRNCRYNSPDGT